MEKSKRLAYESFYGLTNNVDKFNPAVIALIKIIFNLPRKIQN